MRIILASLLLGLLGAAPAEAVELRLKPEASRLSFVARQSMIGETEGRFDRVRAPEFVLDFDAMSNSRVKVVVETASVFTGNEDRDAHLRKADFFEVDAYPEMVFESSEVRGDRDGIQIRGQLIVKGKPSALTLPLRLEWHELEGSEVVRATGSAQVSRRALGLDFETPFFIPDIHDTILIRVDVAATAGSGGGEAR